MQNISVAVAAHEKPKYITSDKTEFEDQGAAIWHELALYCEKHGITGKVRDKTWEEGAQDILKIISPLLSDSDLVTALKR